MSSGAIYFSYSSLSLIVSFSFVCDILFYLNVHVTHMAKRKRNIVMNRKNEDVCVVIFEQCPVDNCNR